MNCIGACIPAWPQNNALQLTRSPGLSHTWSRFAAPHVMAGGGPLQLNAVFAGRQSMEAARRDTNAYGGLSNALSGGQGFNPMGCQAP